MMSFDEQKFWYLDITLIAGALMDRDGIQGDVQVSHAALTPSNISCRRDEGTNHPREPLCLRLLNPDGPAPTPSS